MRFDLKKPCGDCPFLKVGGIRLTKGRIEDLCENMLHPSGAAFSCHKTVSGNKDEHDENASDYMPGPKDQHCAGALIFAEKNGNATQMMRWMERIGVYDHTKIEGKDLVFDSTAQALRTAIR